METVHGQYTQKNLVNAGSTQTRVPARLDLQNACKKVLCVTPTCFVSGIDKAENEVKVRGKIVTRVLFIDEFDGYNSEERSDEFTEKFSPKNFENLECFAANAVIVATGEAKTTRNEADLINAISTEHTVNVGLTALEQRAVEYIESLSGDVETLANTRKISTWGNGVNERFDIGESFVLEPNAEGVMGVDLGACVRDIDCNDDKIVVKGTAFVTISTVKGSEAGQVALNAVHDFDFTKTFNAKGIKKDDIMHGGLSVVDQSFKIENKGKPELALEATLAFTGYAVTTREVKAVEDAFTCTHALEFGFGNTSHIVAAAQHNAMIDVEGNVTMPEQSPFIARVHWARTPIVQSVNTKVADGRVTIDGVMTVPVIYECEDKQIHAHTAAVPFSTTVKADCVPSSNIAATVTPLSCSVKARRGKELLIDAKFGVNVGASTIERGKIVSSCNLGAEKPADKSPIAIHVVGSGEKLFDFAKRVCVPSREIVRQNPWCENEIHDGDRVVLYRQNRSIIGM